MDNQWPKQGWFATTHWSVVLNTREATSLRSAEALESLCRIYWYPIYAYIRRKGYDAETARDLTQSFFAMILEKRLIENADPVKGRFRSYLIATLENMLADDWARSHRQKRGGGRPMLSLDDQNAECRYRREPCDRMTPAKIFERRWALTLIDQAMVRLREECAAEGKARLFEKTKRVLSGDKDGFCYANLAREIDVTEGALRTAVHRLRLRLGQLIRDEIAHTVAEPAEIEEELRHLFCALRMSE